MQKITSEMTLYDGVKLRSVLEAIYSQGKKDGAREVIEKMRQDFEATQKQIPHRNPGRPKGS